MSFSNVPDKKFVCFLKVEESLDQESGSLELAKPQFVALVFPKSFSFVEVKNIVDRLQVANSFYSVSDEQKVFEIVESNNKEEKCLTN